MKLNDVIIMRTEQWEWTARITVNGKSYEATGSSETSAELHLLRLVISDLLDQT